MINVLPPECVAADPINLDFAFVVRLRERAVAHLHPLNFEVLLLALQLNVLHQTYGVNSSRTVLYVSRDHKRVIIFLQPCVVHFSELPGQTLQLGSIFLLGFEVVNEESLCAHVEL